MMPLLEILRKDIERDLRKLKDQNIPLSIYFDLLNEPMSHEKFIKTFDGKNLKKD